MALDFRERRQVSKNRSRRNPVRVFIILALGSICVFYGLGVVTGWLLFRQSTKSPASLPSSQVNNDAGRMISAAPSSSKQNPATPATGNNVPLTFYNTLPKGEKGVMGSGLNPAKEEKVSRNTNDSRTATDAQHKIQKQNSDKTGIQERIPEKEKLIAEKRTESDNVKSAKNNSSNDNESRRNVSYSVQIASTRDKKEAENLQSKLKRSGFAARIVETSIPGKGVWFRVKVGSRMDRTASQQLADKIGKDAIVVPEQ